MTAATTITAPKKISARRLANAEARRAADANKRANKIMVKALFGTHSDEIEAIKDSAGRVVRTTPATKEEIRHALLGNRVLDTIEILETLGEQAFNNLVANGSLKRDSNFNRYHKCNLYWVTTKARELYDLPARIRLSGGGEAAYVEA